jgi:hypothetical protein
MCWNQYTPCLLLSCIIMTNWIVTQLVTTVIECTHHHVQLAISWFEAIMYLSWIDVKYKLHVIYISISCFTCLITVGICVLQTQQHFFFLTSECCNLVNFIFLFISYTIITLSICIKCYILILFHFNSVSSMNSFS